MSTAICAIWLLAAIPGAESPVVIDEPQAMPEVGEVGIDVASDESMMSPLRLSTGGDGCLSPPLFVYRGCKCPEPLLYIDTSCTLRWYTMMNAAYHIAPYNYVVQFDYPWHRESRCMRGRGHHGMLMPVTKMHAPLAPLAQSGDTCCGGEAGSRPSAIRVVD